MNEVRKITRYSFDHGKVSVAIAADGLTLIFLAGLVVPSAPEAIPGMAHWQSRFDEQAVPFAFLDAVTQRAFLDDLTRLLGPCIFYSFAEEKGS